jgi:hypothetical protein
MESANRWRRIFARCIDIAVFGVLEYIVIKSSDIRSHDIYAIYNNWAAPYEKEFILRTDFIRTTTFLIFFFLYSPIMLLSGGTIGQRLTNIKPISALTGMKPKFWQVAIRCTCMGIINCLIFFVLKFSNAYDNGIPTSFLQTLLWIAIIIQFILPLVTLDWNRDGQSFHDKFSFIFIVKLPKKAPSIPIESSPNKETSSSVFVPETPNYEIAEREHAKRKIK